MGCGGGWDEGGGEGRVKGEEMKGTIIAPQKGRRGEGVSNMTDIFKAS